MNQKKKVVLVVGTISLAIITSISLFLGQFYGVFAPLFTIAPDQYVKEYVEENYGIEVDVIDESMGEDGYREFTVSPIKNKDMKFGVYSMAKFYPTFGDDYEFSLYKYEENPKLNSIVSDIEKLGFKGYEGQNIELSFTPGYSNLTLEAGTLINYKTFIKNEFDTYYALYELVHKSNLDIVYVEVENPHADEDNWNSIMFEVGDPNVLKSKKEFLLELEKENWKLVEDREESRFEKEVEAISNERFKFGSRYEQEKDNPYAAWLNCTEVNEESKCTTVNLTVTYTKNSFTASKLQLKEDITAIFNFIDTHLKPEFQMDMVYFEESELEEEDFIIPYENREDIDELIEFITSRDE